MNEKRRQQQQKQMNEDSSDESQTELDNEQPTTSKGAGSSIKRSRRGAKPKYNKNFPGMLLDANESEDDDEDDDEDNVTSK